LEGIQGGFERRDPFGPSKRNGYLSWKDLVSGKPLLVKDIDAEI
jgi:hypothetical protein